ncbi:MAG TPA: hypothetical protein VIG75_08710 [Citricoccus sp.]
MRKPLAAVASAALALGALIGTGVAAPPPAAAAPYCGITWGSLPKYTPTESDEAWFSPHTVKAVRSGRHACFDRLVIDVRGQGIWHNVRYAPVRDRAGQPMSLRGAADLHVFFTNPSTTSTGRLTWSPGKTSEVLDVSGYRTFRQVALANHARDTVVGEDENGQQFTSVQGYTSIGLGVRARLPFRTFVLDGPGTGQRLVIDVAHRW